MTGDVIHELGEQWLPIAGIQRMRLFRKKYPSIHTVFNLRTEEALGFRESTRLLSEPS